MKYKIWIKDRKDETMQTLEVPPYRDGSTPTMLRIKGVACLSPYFTWGDYKQIQFERITTKDDP